MALHNVTHHNVALRRLALHWHRLPGWVRGHDHGLRWSHARLGHLLLLKLPRKSFIGVHRAANLTLLHHRGGCLLGRPAAVADHVHGDAARRRHKALEPKWLRITFVQIID